MLLVPLMPSSANPGAAEEYRSACLASLCRSFSEERNNFMIETQQSR
jgi:hypothetical protein